MGALSAIGASAATVAESSGATTDLRLRLSFRGLKLVFLGLFQRFSDNGAEAVTRPLGLMTSFPGSLEDLRDMLLGASVEAVRGVRSAAVASAECKCSARNFEDSSTNHAGRSPLWPPSKKRMDRTSPPQASCKALAWSGVTRQSSSAAPKRAGHFALGAHLIGKTPSGSKPARLWTSLRTISKPMSTTNWGSVTTWFTNSVATLLKSLKGESRTQAAKRLSFAALMIAVAAPMDRPHKPMEVTTPVFRRCSKATHRSSSSWWPSET
mmetsp:Transcript_10830/g.22859  ORF Transcript_10830/g.22859 Transcript_10830/m.22859 type:complete len:267 (-) Transcript_10830:307-1107(-)